MQESRYCAARRVQYFVGAVSEPWNVLLGECEGEVGVNVHLYVGLRKCDGHPNEHCFVHERAKADAHVRRIGRNAVYTERGRVRAREVKKAVLVYVTQFVKHGEGLPTANNGELERLYSFDQCPGFGHLYLLHHPLPKALREIILLQTDGEGGALRVDALQKGQLVREVVEGGAKAERNFSNEHREKGRRFSRWLEPKNILAGYRINVPGQAIRLVAQKGGDAFLIACRWSPALSNFK